MPYVKNTSYRDMVFSSETPRGEFYTFSTVPDLAAKSERYKDDICNCRTVGILHSTEGRFYMTDVDTPTIAEDKPLIRVTMVYLKSPPKSVVVPYPIQVFGTLQWRNRPVIYAKILQVLSIQMAIRARDTLHAVTRIHLAASASIETSTSVEHDSDLDISYSDLNDTFALDST